MHLENINFSLLGNNGGFVGIRSPVDVTGQLRVPGMTSDSMLNGPNSPADTRGKDYYY